MVVAMKEASQCGTSIPAVDFLKCFVSAEILNADYRPVRQGAQSEKQR